MISQQFQARHGGQAVQWNSITAIKSKVTSIRSKAEAVGTWWRVFIRPDSPGIKSGEGQSAQGVPETQLGALKHLDAQTTPRPMKS